MEIRTYRNVRHPDFQFEIRMAVEDWHLPLECVKHVTGLVEGGYSIQQACYMLQNALASQRLQALKDSLPD